MTMAIREALQAERHVALAALVAGFLSRSPYSDPIRVRSEGFGSKAYRADGETFAALFERFRAMQPDDLLAAAAGVAGDAVSLERHQADQPPMANAGVAALVNAISYERLELALDDHFDPDDFFKRASAKVALDAIAEMGVDKGKAKKKPDLAALAAAGAREKGWLPVQLRTAHYAGPGPAWTPAALEDEGPADRLDDEGYGEDQAAEGDD